MHFAAVHRRHARSSGRRGETGVDSAYVTVRGVQCLVHALLCLVIGVMCTMYIAQCKCQCECVCEYVSVSVNVSVQLLVYHFKWWFHPYIICIGNPNG